MATDSGRQAPSDGVYSDGTRLWRARSGATSTFDENVTARALFVDLHRDQFWNPWRLEEQSAELERALQVMEEWERAEPGLRRKTDRQVEAAMARRDRASAKRTEQQQRRRVANQQRYDPGRVEARLELLEQQCHLQHQQAQVSALRRDEHPLAMDPTNRRADTIAELDTAIERHRADIKRLLAIVGDPEDVPDSHGLLPRDRRFATHYWYQESRITEVRQLQADLAHFEEPMNAAPGANERSNAPTEHAAKTLRLNSLLAMPRPEVEDMCADCALPARGHGYTPPYDGPCSAWPGQRAILAKVAKLLEASRPLGTSEPTLAPAPQPLATIPSGLAVTEVVQRLQALQEQFPEAVVRRGRANRIELWPSHTAGEGR